MQQSLIPSNPSHFSGEQAPSSIAWEKRGRYFVACVQTITKVWLVPSAKQRRDPCSGPPTDSTNYRKCVSNSPSTWLAITTNKTKPFLTGQSWRVLKSGYTVGSPEQGFRRCFADGVNQSLISSARRLLFRDATTGFSAKWRLRKESRNSILIRVTSQIWLVLLIGWSKLSANKKHYPDLDSVASSVWNFCALFSDVISREASGGVAK